jgi:glycosyltransferase involved in cell wall biosynthesis
VPRVSVITPAHNAERFLPEALASVQAQTFGDWEVVAVDDGSSDSTSRILNEAGPRVRALRNETPGGPAAARNRAISVATGELVAFLDADDALMPRYLESQIAFLDASVQRGRRIGLVTCDAYLLDDDGPAAHTYLDMIRDRDKPITLERLLGRNSIHISSLVPREVGEEVGWFDTELFGTEDYGLWLKILEQGYEAIRNPESLVVYRRHDGSISTDIARLGANNRRAYELTLARGALSPHQRRIAKRSIRYNQAMEAVAAARFASSKDRAMRDLIRLAPLLAWVALTNPRWWSQWVAVLRTGRVPPVSAAK